jgi:hypothetical protein
MLEPLPESELAPSEWVLTDFSELSKFTFSAVDTTFSLAVEAAEQPVYGAMRPIERIVRQVVTERRLGQRTWVDVREVTIIRNVPGPRPGGQ